MSVESLLPPEPLFSSRWHRVSGLCPRLRPQVTLRRHAQRGVDWYVLVDTSSDEVRRLNAAAHAFVGRCDGRTPVRRIWEALLAASPEQAMTQDEAVQLLASLHERQLIEFDRAPDVEAVFRGRDALRRRRRWQGVNPLAFRLPMIDPTAWLRRLAPLGRLLYSGVGLLGWCLLLLSALMAGAPHVAELVAEAGRMARTPEDLLQVWLLYPLIKLVHETAHGLAMQRWGAQPRRAGITLLMLTPVPFVDASAADGLRHAHRRAVVSAAGIMAELAIAAVALWVWLTVQPGAVRDLALAAVLVGTVSTLLVNGNPLMRFDGYYVLCDLLDLRNLAPRSARWWGSLLRRRLLGDRTQPPMEALPGEGLWLLLYAPLAALCRLALGLTVTLWLGGFSAALGAVIGAVMVVAQFGAPALSALRAVRAAPGLMPVLRAGAALAILVTLLGLPLPHRSVALGVVWPHEGSQLRAGTEGFLTAWTMQDGQTVGSGDLAARLEDDELDARRTELEADIAELDVQIFDKLGSAPDEVPALREKLTHSRRELERLAERVAALEVRAPVAGRLVLPHQADQTGSFLHRGDLLGYVLDDAPLVLRVAVPHADADLLRAAAPTVEIELASQPGVVRRGHLLREMTAAVDRLPNAALGASAGGDIATDPSDEHGLTPLRPVLMLDVEVPGLEGRHIGERARVRFELGDRSLAARAARQLRQLLLGRFNPSA